MKTIPPVDKISYGRVMQALMRCEDREELRTYAANMRDCAMKMEAKAQELDKRAEWARENNNKGSQFRY